MLKQTRYNQIMEILKRDGEVEISVLCRMFDVSDITIRRDLNELAKEHNIQRTHGGAMLLEEDQIAEPSYAHRIVEAGECKAAIAKKALEFIINGEKLFIDSGSTTFHMAKQLPNTARNIVLTNALNIASEIMLRNNVSVIMMGGDLRRNTLSTRGSLTEEYVSRFHVDVAFLGANAIDAQGNLYVAITSESGLKRAIIANADKAYVLLDNTKFGTTSLMKYAHASDVTGIITDSAVSSQVFSKLSEENVKIIIAD